MAWINALDVPGATLVARLVSAPTVWFDPSVSYPAYCSVAAGVVTVSFATNTNGIGTPVIREFGVKLPNGYIAPACRVVPQSTAQSSVQIGVGTVKMQGVLTESGGSDVHVVDASAALNPSVSVQSNQITVPIDVGAITTNTHDLILSARVVVT